jgi:hypothetical protein
MKELRVLQKERREAEKQKAETVKAERNPRAEGGSENLPNEAIARSSVHSSSELPNEPILTSHPSQISHLRASATGELPNEATHERSH